MDLVLLRNGPIINSDWLALCKFHKCLCGCTYLFLSLISFSASAFSAGFQILRVMLFHKIVIWRFCCMSTQSKCGVYLRQRWWLEIYYFGICHEFEKILAGRLCSGRWLKKLLFIERNPVARAGTFTCLINNC